MQHEKHTFQTETKQLLDLMVHSIYTHREIFLRELISNASDAIDKLKFESLKNPELIKGDSDYKVYISLDRTAKTITISDNGIGMTHDDLVQNIGTIAKSGSKEFVKLLKEKKENDSDVDIIGQFGVGFYSAFMVADDVTIITKAAGNDRAYKWESIGDGTYSIDDTEKDSRGTDIIIKLREDKHEDDSETIADEFLSESKIQSLIKKYSDYIRYPILMDFEEEVKPKDEEGNEIEDAPAETKIETKTLNSMTPLWKRNSSEIKEEEYNEFYKSKFHDYADPLKVIHTKAEGTIEYTALLFIPSKAPFDFYSKEFTKGLQLYSKGVFIMDKCEDVLPEYFRFAKGLIDSPDFSLNISRELLQKNRQLKIIAKNVEKKIKKELLDLLKTDRDKYTEFWNEFGNSIKVGLTEDFGMNKEKIQDLLVFKSSKSAGKMITLEEYVNNMKDEQKFIYFVSGHDEKLVDKLPQIEKLKAKDFEVLYFLDKVDEFAVQSLREFNGKQFKSITQGELDLGEDSKEEKEKTKEKEEQNKDLIAKIKESLKDKVSEVKLTNRLQDSPVCLVSSENGISMEMEKIMAEMPQASTMPGGMMNASKVLEINPDHNLFAALKTVFEKDPAQLDEYSDLLYSQALLIEGYSLDDPVDFSNKMSNLIIKASK